LVVRDDIALTFCFNEYLNFRFHQIIQRKKNSRVITPLFVLAIDDLEKIASHLVKVPLSKILEDRWRNDRRLVAPFFGVQNDSMPKADITVAEFTRTGLDVVASLTSQIMFARNVFPGDD
jgi:hypothetical protein